MINSSDFEKLCDYAVSKLSDELAPSLSYHNLEHTLDVLKYVKIICQKEQVEEHDVILLKTSALLHDMGFIDVYQDHEKRSCQFAKEILPGFGYSETDIVIICGQIMATKIPQSPKTALEKILCDADLDYLGRGDYYPIAGQLYNELKVRGKIKDEVEWNRIQISFLESHTYWTTHGVQNRDPGKQLRLTELREKYNDSGI